MTAPANSKQCPYTTRVHSLQQHRASYSFLCKRNFFFIFPHPLTRGNIFYFHRRFRKSSYTLSSSLIIPYIGAGRGVGARACGPLLQHRLATFVPKKRQYSDKPKKDKFDAMNLSKSAQNTRPNCSVSVCFY